LIQWHPAFAGLLRPVVEGHYAMRATQPVEDTPREADYVLLRRKARATPPFRGLWRYLTVWNVLEFKGPTVSARHGDIERLVELGLGIERRLHVECRQDGRARPVPAEVAFWYLANKLGRRFLSAAERKLGRLEALGPGLWGSRVLGRMVFLVSSIDLPVEEDTLPLHIIAKEPPATERQIAQLVVERPALQALYSAWLAILHPAAWKEAETMARLERFAIGCSGILANSATPKRNAL
jgi:hypothetical protein